MTDTIHAASVAGQARSPDSANAAAQPRHDTRAIPLTGISLPAWQSLAERAAEPNACYLPEWELAVNAFSPGRTHASALSCHADNGDMIGLMPAVSTLRAYQLPLPAFVTADAFPPLGTILIDRDRPDEAVSGLMQQARNSGARALILRDTPIEGAVMQAFTRVLAWNGQRPIVLKAHNRALLDATRDADALLHEALGSKKLKELRRQRNRLADTGEVVYRVATTSGDIIPALEIFLKLEASGWKGKRGTALLQNEGHLAFIRRAVRDMAAAGHCQVISLHAGDTPVAAAIVLRHLDRAIYFKLGVDERFARYSPGVQMTLDLTRQMCADPAIASVDSTADANHSMIDPIWRERLAVGDILIPLHRNDPFVPLIRGALALRRAAMVPARKAVHFIRRIKEKRS
ncbi:GNAT family N-acetyltransferase [[Pseudomonas] carboxydohydrogena]|uniref:GNAT family N-acetyltransferase n=1 Tax=Afipia carboxydohydrogena TaxID=290 RepID=A0ABY8BTJ9_AFICR|nr:GNAT family N-acetyltransferase [[Pseudomonas] carboxydohydrogena]WEF52666.1 GNAT family N-acetyltransferase [[Pseudomonas] carboxydohydrogena]